MIDVGDRVMIENTNFVGALTGYYVGVVTRVEVYSESCKMIHFFFVIEQILDVRGNELGWDTRVGNVSDFFYDTPHIVLTRGVDVSGLPTKTDYYHVTGGSMAAPVTPTPVKEKAPTTSIRQLSLF